jgi:hypothetical protein
MSHTGRIDLFYCQGDGDASSLDGLLVCITLDRLETEFVLTAILYPDFVPPQFDMHMKTRLSLRCRKTHHRTGRLNEVAV